MHNILLRLFCVLLPFTSISQCISPVLEDSCNLGGPLVVNNEVLNAGTTKYYYGPATSLSDMRLNGGTLIVCGDLTIDRFTMDSGRIVVRPGARFVIGNGIGYGMSLRGNSVIHNYGRFEVQRNLSLENSYASTTRPNIVYNAPGAFFKMSNQYFVINNPYSFLINKGASEFHGIITEAAAAAGSVCLGFQSTTRMTVMYNRRRYSYSAPEGNACLNVSEYTQLYDTVTQHQAINLCLGPTHRMDTTCRPFGCRPFAWGTASIFNGCSSCTEVTLLSKIIQSFLVRRKGRSAEVSFVVFPFSEMIRVYVEKSQDGLNFSEFDSVAVPASTGSSSFNSFDPEPLRALRYYRLKVVQLNTGKFQYSSTRELRNTHTVERLEVYPLPFTNTLNINTYGKLVRSAELLDLSGRSYWKSKGLFSKQVISVPHLPAGVYILRFRLDNTEQIVRVLKQ